MLWSGKTTSDLSTRRILAAIHKDVLPTFQQRNVVYEYVCYYNSRYVGQTFQRLQDRIGQHVPKSIRSRTGQGQKQLDRQGKSADFIPDCDSAIGNYLLHNQKYASHYKDNQYFILSKARFDFHLSVLESFLLLFVNLTCIVRKSLFTNINYYSSINAKKFFLVPNFNTTLAYFCFFFFSKNFLRRRNVVLLY